MVALQGDKILPVPLEEAVSKLKTVNMDLYNISKLMGEALCLASHSQKVRIARISNVIGNRKNHNDFL